MIRSEVVELVAFTGELWPTYTTPTGDASWEARITVWIELLGDLDRPVVHGALVALAAAGREYPPPPGVIRRAALDLNDPVAVPPSPDAALIEVMQAARAGESWTSTWSHPAVADAVSAIGWWEITHTENQDALRAQFRDLYKAAATRHDIARYAPPALGKLRALTSTGGTVAARGIGPAERPEL